MNQDMNDEGQEINNLYQMIKETCPKDVDPHLMALCYLIRSVERMDLKIRRIADDIYSFKRFELNKSYSKDLK